MIKLDMKLKMTLYKPLVTNVKEKNTIGTLSTCLENTVLPLAYYLLSVSKALSTLLKTILCSHL